MGIYSFAYSSCIFEIRTQYIDEALYKKTAVDFVDSLRRTHLRFVFFFLKFLKSFTSIKMINTIITTVNAAVTIKDTEVPSFYLKIEFLVILPFAFDSTLTLKYFSCHLRPCPLTVKPKIALPS